MKSRFGKTDLYVSRLCQGTAFRHLPRTADDPQVQRVLQHCLEKGINFFDSSNAYGWGGSEMALGKAIASKRQQVTICTKVAASHPPKAAEHGTKPAYFTRHFLFEQAEESLKRLGTDCIDLYLLHQPDESTPIDDIVDSMDTLVQSGKIRCWGVSNHSAKQVNQFVTVGRKSTKAPIAGIEDYYNISGESVDPEGCSHTSQLEREMFPIIRQSKLGFIAFSPLDAGNLSQKKQIKPTSPLTELVQVLDQTAQNLHVTRAELCVAWVLTHTEVTTVLSGAESSEHVDQNLAGTQLSLPQEVIKTLNSASKAYRKKTKQKLVNR